MLFETVNLRLSTQYRVATLTLDADRLSQPVLRDLDAALGVAERIPALDVLIVRFPASGLKGADHLPAAALGQYVADRLAALDPITVAFIDGPCLGAALELTLACDYRAAAGGPRTRLGFAELRSGIVPGWGGTVRLPRLVGLKRALDLFLTGRKLSAAQALAAGLIDRAFGPRMADVHLAAFALELQTSGRKPQRRPGLVERMPGRRSALLRGARARVEREYSADQVAPRALVAAVAAGVRDGTAAGLAAERAASRQHEPDTQARDARTPSLARRAHVESELIRRIAIIGGGTIGAAVAQWATLNGCAVAIHDRDPAAAWRRLRVQFAEAVERRLIPAEAVPEKLSGIFCTDSWDGFADAELVIEAVDEDRAMKRSILVDVEPRIAPTAVLATTTTAFTVRSLQRVLARSERLVGLHFGYPAAALRRVEVSAGPATDPASVARVQASLTEYGREGVLVADRPGRVLGRVSMAYLHEAAALVGEGVPPDVIDSALRRWGMACGPCATLDAIGLDVALATLRELATARGSRFDPPAALTRLVLRGDHGLKTRIGFYSYARGTPRPQSFGRRSVPTEGTIVERLVARLRREAVATLCEGVVGDAVTLDALLVGAGWPPFRGGPLARMSGMKQTVPRPAPTSRPARVAV